MLFRVLVVSLAFAAASSADEPAEPAKPASHTDRKIEGWTVCLDDRLLMPANEAVTTSVRNLVRPSGRRVRPIF